jgi:hypothetical protein
MQTFFLLPSSKVRPLVPYAAKERPSNHISYSQNCQKYTTYAFMLLASRNTAIYRTSLAKLFYSKFNWALGGAGLTCLATYGIIQKPKQRWERVDLPSRQRSWKSVSQVGETDQKSSRSCELKWASPKVGEPESSFVIKDVDVVASNRAPALAGSRVVPREHSSRLWCEARAFLLI